jgi:sodium-coupled neutral amino acid transporter 4
MYLVHSAVYLALGIVDDGFDPQHEIVIFGHFDGYFIHSLSIQAFAYACHPLIGPTMERLNNPTITRQYVTLGLLCLSAASCYALGGLMPYLTLFTKIQTPVVFVHYPEHRPFTIVAKAFYGIFLTATTPLILYSARLSLNSMFWRSEMTTLRWNLIGVSILVVCILLAITVSSITAMFDIVGGVTCTIIIYILPAVYYLRICRRESCIKTILSWLMIPVGLASMAVCLYQSIEGLL